MQFHEAITVVRTNITSRIWSDFTRLASSLPGDLIPTGREGRCSVQPSITGELELLVTGDPDQSANASAVAHVTQCRSCRDYVETGKLMRRRLRLAVKDC